MLPSPVLSNRALNRALLARQQLLDRATVPATVMIERLVGLQAQVPRNPYVALWSRLADFEPADLERLLVERRAVRIPAIRTTLHLYTADDAARIWPLVAPVLARTFRTTPFGRATRDADMEAVLAEGRRLIEERPLAAAELGLRLAERWPDQDGSSLAQAVHYLVPVVQPTPRGLWSRTAGPTWTTIEAWLGRRLPAALPAEQLVLRYLAAFGPASVADARTWSWLTGLREVFERLRPNLRTFRDERGRVLFDLPDAPRPPGDVAAPPRLLPEYDNLLLSHADRSRVIPPEVGPRVAGFVGRILVDGFLAGQWRLSVTHGAAVLALEPFTAPSEGAMAALVTEAEQLLAFAAADVAERKVELGSAPAIVSRPRARA